MINNLVRSRYSFLVSATVGAICVLAFAPFNRPLTMIVALLILLGLVEQASLRRGLGLGLSFGVGFFATQLYWLFYCLYVVLHLGLVNALLGTTAFVMLMSCYFGLVTFIYKLVRSHYLWFNWLLLFPSCWVIGEWLRGWVFTGYSWSDVAYTQVNNYLMQGFFPLLGSYGVSWISVSIVGVLFLLLRQWRPQMWASQVVTPTIRWAVIYLAAWAGAGYLVHGHSYTQAYGKPVKVALVQGNLNGAEKWDEKKFLANLSMYIHLVAQAKADIILLPETAIATYEQYLPEHYVNDITRLAQMNKAQLVVGIPRVIDKKGNYVNSATVFTESGHPYYAKAHLVPFGEYIPLKEVWGRFYFLAGIPMVGFSAGSNQQQPLLLAQQKVAFNICYENGFGSELIASASASTLMANLSDMVWYGTTIAEDQHLQLSQARALENQRYFIQDTNSGLTAVINPFGVIQSRLPNFTRQTLVDYVQGRIGVTPYQRYGNYLIILWSCLIIVCAALCRRFNNPTAA